MTDCVVVCQGHVHYNVSVGHYDSLSMYTKRGLDHPEVTVEVIDKSGQSVSKAAGGSGTLVIDSVQLWWPYTMTNDSSAYLYTLEVSRSCIQLNRVVGIN